MFTRRRLWIGSILLACGSVPFVWHYWPGNKVRFAQADAATALKVYEDPTPLVYELSSAIEEINWGPDSHSLTVLTKTVGDNQRSTRHLLRVDLATHKHTQMLGTTDFTQGLATWPDSESVGIAKWQTGPDGQCQILRYRTTSGKLIGKYNGALTTGLAVAFTSDPVAIAVSPDGQFVAAGTKLVDNENAPGAHIGGEVCVWNSVSGKLLWHNRTTHTDIVRSVAFSPDSTVLASAGDDKLIRLWNASDGVLKRTIVGAAWHGIESIRFSPSGKLLATGGIGAEDGGSVKVWDIAAGKLLHHFVAFDHRSIVRVAFSRDGRLFATGTKRDSDGTSFRVHAWDPVLGTHLGMVAEGAGATRAIVASPEGRRLAIGTYEGNLLVLDLNGPTGVTRQ